MQVSKYKQSNVDRRQIRFGGLVKLIDEARGKGPFSAWVKEACLAKLRQGMNLDKTKLSHRGYTGTVELAVEPDDHYFYGKIDGIKDLVTYSSKDLEDLKKEFRKAVNLYIKDCKNLDREPEEPVTRGV